MRSRTLTLPAAALLFLGLALTSLACRPGEPPAESGASTPAPDRAGLDASQPLVTLERGPCFGRCPEYAVSIFGDGRVAYVGVRAVAVEGAAAGWADRAAVWAIVDDLVASGVQSADADYGIDHPVCAPHIPDTPLITLTVQMGSDLKQVRFEEGCAGLPAYLPRIAAEIDRVAGVDGWVRGPTSEAMP